MGGSGQDPIIGSGQSHSASVGAAGDLDATAVAPYQAQAAANLVPLKDLVKNISFKQGQRYTDYQEGDKVSDIGLAGLIAGDDDLTGFTKE